MNRLNMFANIHLPAINGYETPKQALETYFAAELQGIIPSDFIGIVRLTNFSSLTPEI